MKTIYYYHVLDEEILSMIDNILYNKEVLSLERLLESKNSDACSIVADDCHVSNKKIFNNSNYDKIYFGIIGSRSFLPLREDFTPGNDIPDPNKNIKAAHYCFFNGNSSYFCKEEDLKDLDPSRFLNHTWSHIKIKKSDEVVGRFNVKDVVGWSQLIRNNTLDFPIYNDIPLNCKNSEYAYTELFYNSFYNINKDFVVAPWNVITDDFVKSAKRLGYKYIIHKKVYSIEDSFDLGICRVSLEKIRDNKNSYVQHR